MNDDKKLNEFLTQHRPLPPEAKPGEGERIWSRIASGSAYPRPGKLTRLFAYSGPLAAALLLVLAVNQTRVNERAADDSLSLALVDDSLSANFLDEEDDAIDVAGFGRMEE